MWDSPDVLEHVNDVSDFKISNLLDTYTFSLRGRRYGVYRHVPQGSFENVVIPDISANRFIEKVRTYDMSSDLFPFLEDVKYRSSTVSISRYNDYTVYSIVLYLNSVDTNARFTPEKIGKIKLVGKEDMREILRDRGMSGARAVKSVSDVDLYESKMGNYSNQATTAYSENIDEWLNFNIPTTDFKNVVNTELYQLLETEIGEEKIIEYISKLDVYRKDVGSDV